MSSLDDARSAVTALEGALVEEFRALQAFLELTKEERRALVEADAAALQETVDRKTAAQAGLARLEAVRTTAIQQWVQAVGQTSGAETLADLLPQLDPATARRFSFLREGILSLATELGELNRGNQALAATALERVESVRAFLIELAAPATGYQPFRTSGAAAESVLTLEQWA